MDDFYNSMCYNKINTNVKGVIPVLELVQYLGPIICILIIFALKFFVDENAKIERIKRMIAEVAIDIMSLAMSFILSFVISAANKITQASITRLSLMDLFKNVNMPSGNILINKFYEGLLIFIGYILLLIIVVGISKATIRKYSETEKIKYIVIGSFLGYTISIAALYYSIVLLNSLGGF